MLASEGSARNVASGGTHKDVVDTTPRRIRHIKSIQVRNLTPFPVRDTFASALTQPAEQSQFNSHGHFSDDLDLTIGRKRTRKVSTASIHSLYGNKSEGESSQGDPARASETPARRRTLSRASTLNGPTGTSTTSPKLTRRGGSVAPTVRPSHRPRGLSVASSHTSGAFGEVSASSSSMLSSFLPDTSQKALEKILQARLVETFITISIPQNAEADRELAQPVTPPLTPPPRSGRVSSPARGHDTVLKTIPRRGTVTASVNTPSSLRTTYARGASLSVSSGQAVLAKHAKSASTSNLATRPTNSKSSLTSPKQRPAIPASLSSPLPKTPNGRGVLASPDLSPLPSPPLSTSSSAQLEPFVPDYISPVHRHSTNPSFQLDVRPGYEFAPGADLSGSTLRLEVWARAADVGACPSGTSPGHASSEARFREDEPGGQAKGKGREREHGRGDAAARPEWKILEAWEFDLEELVPLPDDLAAHPAHLPPNTLLLALGPPGRTFFLPAPSLRPLHPHADDAGVSATGYSSDPENDARKVRSAGDLILPEQGTQKSRTTPDDEPSEAGSDSEEQRSLKRRKVRSAGWQDLLKLINLQACITDTEQSLADLVRKVDASVTQPSTVLSREVSERQAWVNQLENERRTVEDDCSSLRERIRARREDLLRRRETLAIANESLAQDSQVEPDIESDLFEERARLSSLREALTPSRSALIATLSDIFPIELRSPPDLLFTVLEVPLPIPLGPSDPAPPLTVPAHKDIGEETVATALGYAAQVVQLLAAYLGKHLVYPVTCVGSRSLIKDGISAMVGPRMFPLFSRGVDTYRFEYGVFLLNKDIEMLMVDRNLRALDMRHTLPNLKNLLLTLTDGELAHPPPQRFLPSSSDSIVSLQSPILTASTPPIDITHSPSSPPDGLPDTEASAPIAAETIAHGSPPASGATTPELATPTARKSRAFLDLAPLAGFLRVRYPSASRAAKVPAAPAQEGDATPVATSSAVTQGEPEEGEDEDDRRTIRGASMPLGEDGEEGKRTTATGTAHENGGAVPAGVDGEGREKAASEGAHDAPAVLVNGTS
ncbi:hypothetical protein CERSUDRAFT_110089 [Gelatoporia subvermispora B]|uniref:Autophagy-related protein 14 n=1 Tax=Ceriporiopsis subvermispora (strain B) TaxID=914234 RepID=M2RSW9_CERS8|nr:hypothetical protein CERSUDRAFT_110089 [Gelatoporia subvermispora B]